MATTSKNTFPSGGNVYTKNASTAFKIAGSTGNLFHQAIALPNTTLITPLANVVWPSTSQAITLLATTIASDAGLYKSPTSQVNPLATAVWPSTVAQTLVNTSDSQTLLGKTLSSSCVWISNTPTSVSTATRTLTPYGLNTLSCTTATGTQAYTLSLTGSVVGAPVWIYAALANTTDTLTVATTKANLINASSLGGLQTITFGAAATMARLMTVSTTLGWVIDGMGTTLYSTCSGASTTIPTFTS